MSRVKDRKQPHLFYPWYLLSPKRHKMLDSRCPEFFREHILDLLQVDMLALPFPNEQGRPTKELYTVLSALALQKFHGLAEQQVIEQLAYNNQWHYLLDIFEESDQVK